MTVSTIGLCTVRAGCKILPGNCLFSVVIKLIQRGVELMSSLAIIHFTCEWQGWLPFGESQKYFYTGKFLKVISPLLFFSADLCVTEAIWTL